MTNLLTLSQEKGVNRAVIIDDAFDVSSADWMKKETTSETKQGSYHLLFVWQANRI